MHSFMFKCMFYIGLIISLAEYSEGQTNKCQISQWKCTNGDCIQYEELCDGIVNCSDGSDETINSCASVTCPYGFRCAYGACVNKATQCNGIQDCADNSDEINLNCSHTKNSFTKKGSCSNFEFQCKSGQCLPIEQLCDGKYDCDDKSDETLEQCISAYCPSFGFRCSYGACINYYKTCDGKNDCVDGSDELPSLCASRIPITPMPPITPTEATSKPVVFESNENDGSCILDVIPENGKAVLGYNQSIELKKGDRINQFEGIVYKCIDSPDTDMNICQDGKWAKTKIITCKKYCSGLQLDHPTIKSDCEYNFQSIRCGSILNPATIVTLSCQFGYQKPDGFVKTNIHCLKDGIWDYPAFRCEQVCGTGPEKGVQYSIGGVQTNITEVPWHSGIYDTIKIPGKYTQICGGTILSSNIILTAAHCFWDEHEKMLYNAKYFQIGVGKSRRSYYESEPLETQLIQVKQIFTNPQYSHSAGLYLADIALLLLDTHIIFRWYVKPICLEYNLINSELTLRPDTMGTVAGWGVEESGLSSEDLKILEVPYKDYATCLAAASDSYKSFIVSDKFCGGYLNEGTSLCQGDSGGGWVYSKEINGIDKYFLRGIVSNGENLKNSCDPNKYTTFTSVEFYFPWILEILARFSPNAIPPSEFKSN